jgi:hypothetical protein
MNSDIVGRLHPYCDDPPDDLVSHFAASSLPNAPNLFINLLNLDDSLDYTSGIQDTFIGEPLGLVVLDDANNSNPFCYVTRGPARGLILHLKHDDASAFAFSSLSRFLDAIGNAIETHLTIDGLVFDTDFPSVAQPELAAYLQNQSEHDGVAEVICIMITLLHEPRPALADSLAAHDDFYVRESLADFIALNPSETLLSAATMLSSDSHAQVARPGKRALDVIRQLKKPR